MIDFKGHRFEKNFILLCARWYLVYSLSYRNLKEMMRERGVEIDHSNIYRWVQKFTPQLEASFRKGKKRPVGKSWVSLRPVHVDHRAGVWHPHIFLVRIRNENKRTLATACGSLA